MRAVMRGYRSECLTSFPDFGSFLSVLLFLVFCPLVPR